MTKRKSDFTLPTLDDLFTTQAERDDAKLERVKNIPLDELHPFKNHAFQILGFTGGGQNGMIVGLRAIFHQTHMFFGISGGLVDHVLELFGRNVL